MNIFRSIYRRIHRKVFIYQLRKKSIIILKNSNVENAVFQGHNFVGRNVNICNSSVGIGTYISDGCNVPLSKIGSFCSIAKNVEVLQNNHPVSNYVSSHPSFSRGIEPLMRKIGLSFNHHKVLPKYKYLPNMPNIQLEIGSDVWIGDSVKIMSGVKIGHGAIIGAGAVVTKDVLPYSVIGGVPAKFIKLRFNDDIVDSLINIAWWEWPISVIEKRQSDFIDVNEFVKKFHKINTGI